MSAYKLSICIPTYNRGAYIGETLESIVCQENDSVEIVVSDNASRDETEAVVKSYAAKFSSLRYHRFKENQGADANYLKVVELAQGEFCWLLGSDDIIELNAIGHVLKVIDSHTELSGLTVKTQSYNSDLSATISNTDIGVDSNRFYSSAAECFTQLGPWFGYLSAQIVRRAVWMKVVNAFDLVPYSNAYVHVYVIARMLEIEPRWMYLDTPCVGWRSGNDSFLDKGIYNRIMIDVLGYKKITMDVFGEKSRVFSRVMVSVATIHVRYALVNAKANNVSLGYLLKLGSLTVCNYWRYPAFWIKVFPIFLMPKFFIQMLRRIRGKYKSKACL